MKHFLPALALLTLAVVPPQVSASPMSEAVHAFVHAQTRGLPGTVEIRVGELDRRTRFAPCTKFSPFLPANGRLWGRSSVGVRCLAPSRWTAYVPVEVSILGRYLRIRRQVPAGQALSADDIEVVDGDLGTLPQKILTDPLQAIGKPPRIGLAAGQPLRADQIISPPLIRQGQTVRLISSGPGFVASSEGLALNNAAEGETVRVKSAAGRTLQGTARADGSVDVGY